MEINVTFFVPSINYGLIYYCLSGRYKTQSGHCFTDTEKTQTPNKC